VTTIGIHNEPSGAGIGGAECLVAGMAEALGDVADVEIVHHRHGFEVRRWASFSGTNLSNVRFRYVELPRSQPPPAGEPWQGYRHAKAWQADLSRPYDIFVTVTHGVPPFCHAPSGILVVLFPMFNRLDAWPWNESSRTGGAGSVKPQLRRRYYEWAWQKRFSTYRTRLAISEFSRRWTRAYWGVECEVLYPPVDTAFQKRRKSNRIVSVGRFSLSSHPKNHPLLLETFARLADIRAGGWVFRCLGGLGASPVDAEYFAALTARAAECGAVVCGDVERGRLIEEYEEAKIFWHAAGYGADHPSRAEHFGIATVEAMAAGCVPVVVDAGAQSEIVEHGVSGFLWKVPDELVAYTRQLVADDELRARMSAAARARASIYARERFASRIQRLVSSQRV
jgi:glycosyltransferase involved in cell wall biosynthesis